MTRASTAPPLWSPVQAGPNVSSEPPSHRWRVLLRRRLTHSPFWASEDATSAMTATGRPVLPGGAGCSTAESISTAKAVVLEVSLPHEPGRDPRKHHDLPASLHARTTPSWLSMGCTHPHAQRTHICAVSHHPSSSRAQKLETDHLAKSQNQCFCRRVVKASVPRVCFSKRRAAPLLPSVATCRAAASVNAEGRRPHMWRRSPPKTKSKMGARSMHAGGACHMPVHVVCCAVLIWGAHA